MKKILLTIIALLSITSTVNAAWYDFLFKDAKTDAKPEQSIILGADFKSFQRSLVPIDSTENLGTSTSPWDELHVNKICLSANCKTAWPTGSGGSGSGTFATSTAWGSILYNYPLNASDIVLFGYDGAGVATSTGEAKFSFDPVAKLGLFLDSVKVGIGTTSPYAALSVVGEAVARNFTATSTTATSSLLGGFDVKSTSLVVDQVTGKVGIGKLPGTASYDLYTTGVLADSYTVSGGAQFSTGSFYFGSGNTGVQTMYDWAFSTVRPVLTFNRVLEGTAYSMYAGVGTTAPAYAKFGVQPTIYDSPTINQFVVASSSNQVSFMINNLGNVGIGTTSPYAKLSVVGQIVGSYFTATTTATSTFAGGIDANEVCITGTTKCLSSVGSGSGTVTSVGVSSSGSITVGSSPITTSGTITADLNMGNANTWTALQSFANSSTTLASFSYASSTLGVFGNVGIGTSTPSSPLEILLNTTSTSVDLIRISNGQGSATARPGLSWYDSSIGQYTSARLSSSIGASRADSRLWFQVADASKALQDRAYIDVNGLLFVNKNASTTQFSTLDAAYIGRLASTTIRGDSATSTFSGAISTTYASTTATSTMSGINLPYGGCFAINGLCITGGGVGSSASTTLLSDNNTFTGLNTITYASTTAINISSYASTTDLRVSGLHRFDKTIGGGKVAAAGVRVDVLTNSDFTQGFRVESDLSTRLGMSSYVTGDSNVRFTFRTDGLLSWGDGTTAGDTNLFRDSANVLKTDDTFISAYSSTTAASNLDGLFSGRTATTTIRGDLASSTFSGAISATYASTTATSTMAGINLPYGGCFAIAGVCITGGAGGSQTPWTSNIDGGGFNLSSVGTITMGSFTANSSTATSTLTNSLAIGTSTSSSRLEVNGGFHVEEQQLATSTSMSIDFCSKDTSNKLRMLVGSSNITVTFTNYAQCVGKVITIKVGNPVVEPIASTTFTASNLHWDGYVDPGNNVTLGGMDEFVFEATNGTSTPFIWAKLNSTLP